MSKLEIPPVDRVSDTVRPPAADLEVASERLDTAALGLLNSSSSASLTDADAVEIEHTLRDHGHALLRAADALAAKRLKGKRTLYSVGK